MDPEHEAIVLFISTTKWSIKVTSIDRRTPPNTSLTVYIIQLITIYSLPFILGNWDLRFESFGVYASSHLESTLRNTLYNAWTWANWRFLQGTRFS